MSPAPYRPLSRLEPQQYFESVDADTERLLAVAARGLDAAVPCCPGWTVADVATHLAGVYEHKVRVMADNAWPNPWPPQSTSLAEPLDRLADAKAQLFAEFAEHQITEPTTTFSAEDGTIAFWARRMALEVAVHRYDAELAADDVTPIPDDLAVDGIDEVLRVMLGGPWWESRVTTSHPIDAVVAIEADGHRWVCAADAKQISIAEGASSDDAAAEAAATISGEPTAVFLWLWGRVGDDRVRLAGDAEVVGEFRARLAECTG